MAMTALKALAAATLLMLSAAPAAAQSLEEMAGQMIVVGFSGDRSDAPAVVAARDAIASGTIGGVMYLRPNVASLDAVAQMNADFLAAAPGLPPLITLDQEGGQVERLTRAVGFGEIASAQAMGQRNSPDEAQSIYADLAGRLAALGFTVNFGPVVDIALNPANQVIAGVGRAYGTAPDAVIPYAEAFVAGHRAAGVLTALKHFPGHGSSRADSHEGFVDITASWQEAELEPYRALISAGLADLVMVGHLFHADYGGAAELPSSLSPLWIEGVLRDELGFDGVVISDDLEMGAIRQHYGLRDTVVLAVRAGMDLLLFSNTADYRPTLGAEIRAILVEEAEADPAFAARIAESYGRIAALKRRL